MPPIDRPTFERLLRGLDPEAFARFVARLWAARGWAVRDVDGGILATREDPPEAVRIQPVTGHLGNQHSGNGADSPDIVVTARRDTHDLASCRVMDADDLYELALYGIDRTDLDPVFQETFGRSVHSVASDRRDIRSALSGVAGRLGTLGDVRALGVTLLVTAVVLAGASAVALDDGRSAPPAGISPPETLTAVPVETGTGTPTPVPMQSTNRRIPACPRPPSDATPHDIRPAVIPHVSPSGLEGWTITASLTVDTFPGPNALPTPIVPEMQHVATYRDPPGTTYRLVISRWESPEEAIAVAEAARPDRFPWIVWGRYTAQATVFDEDGQIRTDSLAEVNTRLLFSQIQTPDGNKLGDECINAMLGGTPLSGDGTPQPTPSQTTGEGSTEKSRS